MNIISKIKLNYYNNLFQTYINDNNRDDFIHLYEKCVKGSSELSKLLLKYAGHAIDMPESEKIFNKNIVWINSFDLDDCHLVNNFIRSYFIEENIEINNYCESLANENRISQFFNKITFNDFQQHSYYFQLQLCNSNNQLPRFLNSGAAFFETADGKMFTHPRLTACYIYIIKNPLDIFKKLLKSFDAQTSLALGKLLNLDQQPEIVDSQITIEEMQSDWATNVHSWTNENVVNTFRGLIIKYEDLINDPTDTLASIIFHLNESGYNFKLDYKKIGSFINTMVFPKTLNDNDVPSSSKKRISRALHKEAHKHGYDI